MITTAHRRPWRNRLGVLSMASLLALTLIVPATAQAAAGPITFTVTLAPNGDPGASGTATLTVNPTTYKACFVADITLTDPVGDPVLFVGVNDTRLRTNVTKIWFPATFTAVGGGVYHDEGCKFSTASRVDDILDHGSDYGLVTYTKDYGDLAASGGPLVYPYATAAVDVATKLCPYSIRTTTALAGNEAQCQPIVVPADSVAGDNPGYSNINYGGTKTFDDLVTDTKNLDATISDADLLGVTGACDAGSLVCDWRNLRYRFENAAAGQVKVKTTVPTGTKLGRVDADVPASTASGTITLDMSGGDASVTVYLFYLTDTTKPTVSTPQVRFTTGATYGPTAPVKVSWTGTDNGSGIDHYTVQRRVGSGSYVTLADDLASSAVASSYTKGPDHRFRVRAVDKAGNVGAWSYSASSDLAVVQDTSSRVKYGGSWGRGSSATATGGTVHYASTAGKTAKLTFTGRAVTWIAPDALTRGKAKVYIDGTYVTTLDLYGPIKPRVQQFSKGWASIGTHSITIKVVGTPGRPRIDIDAFAYLR